MNHFVVDRVSWHTDVRDNPERPEMVKARFGALLRFLDENQLTLRPLLPDSGVVSDDFALRTDDLTADGILLMKKAYDKWLESLDRGAAPGDTSVLDRALNGIKKNAKRG